jgi:2Fe-2S ferredoxin
MALTLHFVTPAGATLTVRGRSGQSLMRAAVDGGIDGIAADCGGCLTCATCHVIVDEPWLGRLDPAEAGEHAVLEMTAAPRQPGSRLSCQIRLGPRLDGLTVKLPPTQY